MRLTVYSSSPLGVGILMPNSGSWWNWHTGAWGVPPFVAGVNVYKLASVVGTFGNPLLTQIVTADLGTVLLDAPYSTLVVFGLDASGNPISLISMKDLHFAGPSRFTGGWS
jgi:hypothetical protein